MRRNGPRPVTRSGAALGQAFEPIALACPTGRLRRRCAADTADKNRPRVCPGRTPRLRGGRPVGTCAGVRNKPLSTSYPLVASISLQWAGPSMLWFGVMVIPLVAVPWALGICESIEDSKVNAGTGDEPALPDFFPV